MNKVKFIKLMNRELHLLKKSERDEILAEFEEHFRTGMENGKSDEEVAAELGKPSELAIQYKDEIDFSQLSGGEKAAKISRKFLVAFGLLLFNGIIGIPVIASIFSVWVSLWTVPLSTGVTGLALLAAAIIPNLPIIPTLYIGFSSATIAVSILAGISLIGLTVLMGIGMIYVSKWFFRLVAAYVSGNIKAIKGE